MRKYFKDLLSTLKAIQSNQEKLISIIESVSRRDGNGLKYITTKQFDRGY